MPVFGARVTLTVAILVSACGRSAPHGAPDAAGGDAGPVDARPELDPDASPDAPPDTEIPDTTPPNLLGVTPAPGSDAWLHHPIRFSLDEPVTTPGLVVSATLAGAAILATAELDPTGEVVVVTIDPTVRGVGALTLEVTGVIADAEGNALVTPLTVDLVVSPWARPLVDRGVAASSPVLAVSDAGELTAAWVVGAGGARRVVVSRFEAAAWQPLGGLLGAGETSSPALVLDPTGAPVVGWIEAGAAHVARWDGAAWQLLASPGMGSAVALAAAPGEAPVVAVTGATIAVATLAGTAWQPVGGALALADTLAGEPVLAAAAGGRIAVGWIEVAAGVARARVSRFAASWTALAPIPIGAPPARLALAARDQTIAIAWDQRGGSSNVYAATVTGTATSWTRLARALDVDVAGDALSPAIAIDAAGAPVVAWNERIDDVERGVIATWTGGAWRIVGGPSWLVSGASPLPPRIALHAGEAPVIGWAVAGSIAVAALNGPRIAGAGLTSRAPVAGCALTIATPPARLLQTGCFTLPAANRPVPHAGLVPYDLVAKLWSDGTKKRRWIVLPDGASMTLAANGSWTAPAGTIIIKEFAIETTPGSPVTRRPVETRYLVRNDVGWQGFTYRWRADGTDADLLSDGQQTYVWPLTGGGTYTHFYPSRTQCRSCHQAGQGPLIGLRPEQLARWFDYRGVIADQLTTLAQLGVGPASTAAPLPSPYDPAEPVERRVRGYMAANCAHCHNPGNIGIKDLRITTALAQTRLCEVIVPGDPAGSRLHQLVTQRPGMPPLGTLQVDPLAGELVGTWISGMTSCP